MVNLWLLRVSLLSVLKRTTCGCILLQSTRRLFKLFHNVCKASSFLSANLNNWIFGGVFYIADKPLFSVGEEVFLRIV